jgi:hypothetical protein
MTSTLTHHKAHLDCALPTSEAAACGDIAAVPQSKNEDFIDETIAVWQSRTVRRLTREDGREIAENMIGFFRVLLEWDTAERATERSEDDALRGRTQQTEL